MSVTIEEFTGLPNPVKIDARDTDAAIQYYEFCKEHDIEMFDAFMEVSNETDNSSLFFGFNDPNHAMMFKLRIK